MLPPPRLALVGDHDPSVVAHRAIPVALELAAAAQDVTVAWEWLPTEQIDAPAAITRFDGVWCVPASPYKSAAGALLAIREARERRVPFLGTCGGFQHAILEYARAVLGWHDAEHGEEQPGSERAVIAPLACSLVEESGTVHLMPETRLACAYAAIAVVEGYHCRYGVNPAFREALTSGALRVVATDDEGDVRAVELEGHPFFVATLFQPERAALGGRVPPIVAAFVRAVVAHAAQGEQVR